MHQDVDDLLNARHELEFQQLDFTCVHVFSAADCPRQPPQMRMKAKQSEIGFEVRQSVAVTGRLISERPMVMAQDSGYSETGSLPRSIMASALLDLFCPVLFQC